MNLKFAGAFIAYLRAGRMGDAAAMKAAMFGARAYPEIAEKLRMLRAPFPTIDLGVLRALPEASFGRQYAAFLDRNRLRPFQVSPEVAEELWPEHVLEVRYPLLHDAFHVLLDFDISLAGELGVAHRSVEPAHDHGQHERVPAKVEQRIRDHRREEQRVVRLPEVAVQAGRGEQSLHRGEPGAVQGRGGGPTLRGSPAGRSSPST